MEDYVFRQQKKLRRGFTTGTCAAAAAKGAAYELLTGLKIKEVTVRLPSGERPKLPVYPAACLPESDEEGKSVRTRSAEMTGNDIEQDEKGAACYCIKDAGDDPDVTNQAKIYVEVKRIAKERIPSGSFLDPEYPGLVLTGGEGVGTVTKPGLEQEVGQPAINKVPRKMIFESVQEVLDQESDEDGKGVNTEKLILITVSVGKGEEIAQKTFNPKLGIRSGISILGTTGIVEPMSEAALVATIEVEIRQTIREGQKHILFVPGNYGEKYVRNELKLSDVHTIQCSNYVGDAIDLAVSYQAESILFVGNFGKLEKLAAGIMNTHSRYADGRWEIMAAHAALCGADRSVLKEIRNSITTDQMLTALGSDELRKSVVSSIIGDIDAHLKRRAGDVPIGAVLYSEKYGFLGQTEEAEEILQS